MTDAQTQIMDLFETLPLEQRRELLAQMALSLDDDFDESEISPEDWAAIQEGLAQAERGETISAEEVMSKLAAKFNFPWP